MAESGQSDDAGRELRRKILNTAASEAGIEQSVEVPNVWGLVVDWPVNDQIATVVALADGHASLYTTSSFGVLGGSGHERVRDAARRVVAAAGERIAETTPADAFPYPGDGQVFFYFLTFEGVRAATADAEGIEDGSDRLTSLFGLTQEVLTELRLVQEGGRAESTSTGGGETGNEREWFGIPGYLNCLLTAMSRGIGNTIGIMADEPLPDLGKLSAGNADLHSWILAQEFDYTELGAPELIALLKNSVRFRGLPFKARRGEIKTMHAREDGEARARVFDLELARGDKAVRITMAEDDDPRVLTLQARANATRAGAERS